jgi:GT2 family glycosyltransferase
VIERIYILLPVHNRYDVTQRFLECLKSQEDQNYHLVLIDDGSTDSTGDLAKKYISSPAMLTVLTGEGKWWWGGSLQQGYQWLLSQYISEKDFVLIINNDTEFEPDFLRIAVRLLRKNTGTLLLAQCYDRENGSLLDSGLYVDWRRMTFAQTVPENINCLSTRGLFLSVGDFYRIGGFYPRLLPHYLSDYEFTIRAIRKGMKPLVDAELKLWLDQNSTGHRQVSYASFSDFFKTYYSNRSVFNPFRWTIFIALACPWPWKIVNWLRIWKRAVGSMGKVCAVAVRNAITK